MHSYEELKACFLRGCQMRLDVDYASKASVRRYNRGMDECRKAVAEIDALYPEMLEDFLMLLQDEVDEVRDLCAFCVLDLARLTEAQEERALRQVRCYFEREDNAFAMELWLEEWKARREGTNHGA